MSTDKTHYRENKPHHAVVPDYPDTIREGS